MTGRDDTEHALRIRRLGADSIWPVVCIEWRAFPEDPWTTATAKGRLASSPVASHPRAASRLARVIRLTRATAVMSTIGLVRFALLKRPASLTWVIAEAGSIIAGFARLNAIGGRGDIQTIAVRPDFEGRGIGTALLADLATAARDCGCRELSLYVRADNARARRLYERTGFTEAGILTGYYRPSCTDAIVMRMDLEAAQADVTGPSTSDEEASASSLGDARSLKRGTSAQP